MEPTGTNGRTRHTLSDPLVGDWVSSCGGFLVGWQGTLFLVVTMTILVRRLSFASVVRFPDRHDRNRGWFRCRPPVFPVGRLEWFCGGHGPGETPGPFPNPEAKAWHGDGTALERVWESSTPPHSTVWTFWSSPLGGFPEGPFFYSHRVFSSARWGIMDVGKPACGRIHPVGGGFRTVEGLWTYWLFQ